MAIAVLAVAALGAAAWMKAPCVTEPWHDSLPFRRYCYNDLLPLYGPRGQEADLVPYVEADNEYPVLSGMYMWAMAALTEDRTSYLWLSFAGLLLAGAAATLALWRTGLEPGRVAAWLALPPLALHGLTNWDLLAVAMACWAWHEWTKGRMFSSALLFGLGGATKVYPAFFLPFLFLALWRGGDRRGMRSVALGGALGLLVPNLLLAIATPEGWWYTYSFHIERGPGIETPFQAFLFHYLQPLFPGFDWDDGWSGLVGAASGLLFLGALAWLAWRTWRRGLDPLVAGGLATLAFLLSNRVYSPQYTLWVLPILLLLHARMRTIVAFAILDALNLYFLYRLFTPPTGGEGFDMTWDDWSRLAINLRWVALAWATWDVVRRHADPGPAAPARQAEAARPS